MTQIPVWIYIAVMALVTYIIRAVPFVAFRKKISSRFVRSLLYYLPYSVLSAMTIPAIFSSTGNPVSGICGFAAAFVCALKGKSLLFVALAACVCAFAAAAVMSIL